MKNLLLLLCVLCPLALSAKKNIKLNLSTLSDKTARSALVVPTVNYEASTLYFYSNISIMEMKVQISNAETDNMVYEETMCLPKKQEIPLMLNLESGIYVLHIIINSDCYTGCFEVGNPRVN